MSQKFDFKKITMHARELRNNMTESEKLLWKELRGKRISGSRFLRQHPILYKGNLTRYNYFIADFYCNEKKVIIEVDGQIHNGSEDYDEYRDNELEELKNMKEVLDRIIVFLNLID